MKKEIFNEILNENFYKLNNEDKQILLQKICSDICFSLGFINTPTIALTDTKNFIAMANIDKNTIVVNTKLLKKEDKIKFCIVLIHECIHLWQNLNREKYEPFITHELSFTPFYYFQNLEQEAFSKSCKIASSFDKNFKNVANNIFKSVLNEEEWIYKNLYKCGFLENKHFSLLKKYKNLKNYRFFFEDFPNSYKEKINNLMKEFLEEKQIIEYFTPLPRKVIYEKDEIKIFKTDNFYMCFLGKRANINFIIKENVLYILNIQVASSDYFDCSKNDYYALKTLLKIVKDIKLDFEKENKILLNVKITKFIFQFKYEDKIIFTKNCIEYLSK